MAAILGLLAAFGYGLGDFVAGMLSRRVHFAIVAVLSGAVALTVSGLATVIATPVTPEPEALLWGAMSGSGMAVGTLALFRGLGRGRMGVVAPVSAVTAAAIPVVIGVVLGDRPAAIAWAGVALALPAIWLVSATEGEGPATPGHVGLAASASDGLVAGLGSRSCSSDSGSPVTALVCGRWWQARSLRSSCSRWPVWRCCQGSSADDCRRATWPASPRSGSLARIVRGVLPGDERRPALDRGGPGVAVSGRHGGAGGRACRRTHRAAPGRRLALAALAIALIVLGKPHRRRMQGSSDVRVHIRRWCSYHPAGPNRRFGGAPCATGMQQSSSPSRSLSRWRPSPAPAARGATPSVPSDFDGDGYSDLAVGVPGQDLGGHINVGQVNVIYGSATGLTAAGDQVWWQGSPGIKGVPEGRDGPPGARLLGDAFGGQLASGDFDGDGYADLAVTSTYDRENGDALGAVNVIYGGPAGLDATGDQLFSPANLPDGVRDVGEALRPATSTTTAIRTSR